MQQRCCNYYELFNQKHWQSAILIRVILSVTFPVMPSPVSEPPYLLNYGPIFKCICLRKHLIYSIIISKIYWPNADSLTHAIVHDNKEHGFFAMI